MARGRKQWREVGKAARKRVSRSALGHWQPPADRRDPVAILEQQGQTRAQDLVPLRYRRMLATPFTFYRGAAAVMAADLAATPDTGLRCQIAGDAHLANFGGYASPERNLVFDVNDFDETLPGPFEWDLKRLAASFEVAGRHRAFGEASRRDIISAMGATYRQAMHEFAGQTRMDVWYARVDATQILDQWGAEAGAAARKRFADVVAKAQRKTSARALARLTETDAEGRLRLRSDPPILEPIEQLLPPGHTDELMAVVRKGFTQYRRSLQADRRYLFGDYELIALGRKVVGVGSVGTRCWVALFTAQGDAEDPLVLQLKQAEASVLEPFAGAARQRNHGERVVQGQRLMQAASDIFLGWLRIPGVDGVDRDYYVRQLWDWKESADLDTMTESTYRVYGQVCGWTLARAHARSGRRNAITAYLGTGDQVDRALADFAYQYADQNEADHQRLQQAAEDGEIEVADSDPAER